MLESHNGLLHIKLCICVAGVVLYSAFSCSAYFCKACRGCDEFKSTHGFMFCVERTFCAILRFFFEREVVIYCRGMSSSIIVYKKRDFCYRSTDNSNISISIRLCVALCIAEQAS